MKKNPYVSLCGKGKGFRNGVKAIKESCYVR